MIKRYLYTIVIFLTQQFKSWYAFLD